jgi:hypothetical protein
VLLAQANFDAVNHDAAQRTNFHTKLLQEIARSPVEKRYLMKAQSEVLEENIYNPNLHTGYSIPEFDEKILSKVVASCQVNDVITLPNSGFAVSALSRLCDLQQPVITMGNVLICRLSVMKTQR